MIYRLLAFITAMALLLMGVLTALTYLTQLATTRTDWGLPSAMLLGGFTIGFAIRLGFLIVDHTIMPVINPKSKNESK